MKQSSDTLCVVIPAKQHRKTRRKSSAFRTHLVPLFYIFIWPVQRTHPFITVNPLDFVFIRIPLFLCSRSNLLVDSNDNIKYEQGQKREARERAEKWQFHIFIHEFMAYSEGDWRLSEGERERWTMWAEDGSGKSLNSLWKFSVHSSRLSLFCTLRMFGMWRYNSLLWFNEVCVMTEFRWKKLHKNLFLLVAYFLFWITIKLNFVFYYAIIPINFTFPSWCCYFSWYRIAPTIVFNKYYFFVNLFLLSFVIHSCCLFWCFVISLSLL